MQNITKAELKIINDFITRRITEKELRKKLKILKNLLIAKNIK